MRILHISTRLILGGSQENTVLSCEGQSRLGHEVHLAFGPIYGPEGSLLERVEKFRTGDGRRITTHVVARLAREINPIADLRCYFELKALIERVRPDVVHTHSSKAGILGRAAAWAGKGHGASSRIVHTVHGPPFHRYQSRVLHRLYVASERFAAGRCDVIVSVADAMTRQYLAEGIGKPEQYVTVRSGMEVGAFLDAARGESREEVRAGLGLAPDDFVIGTVARLAELKGHDDLLSALAEDLKKNPNWKLLWVGDGWWRERLLARARGAGLGVLELDRGAKGVRTDLASGDGGHDGHDKGPGARSVAQVIVTGLVPPERIPGMMRAMDVLAHPSYREGLPRTVPQALLCGVCPVAYDVDGTGEVCRDGETGRLVKAGDVAGLRSALEWCAAHPVERAAMAARGREECRVAYSAERMVDDLERVYETRPAGTPRK
jgi:glycosyltransferase involved in cell wall biosynthesis